jgi:hypothetical protein
MITAKPGPKSASNRLKRKCAGVLERRVSNSKGNDLYTNLCFKANLKPAGCIAYQQKEFPVAQIHYQNLADSEKFDEFRNVMRFQALILMINPANASAKSGRPHDINVRSEYEMSELP